MIFYNNFPSNKDNYASGSRICSVKKRATGTATPSKRISARCTFFLFCFGHQRESDCRLIRFIMPRNLLVLAYVFQVTVRGLIRIFAYFIDNRTVERDAI